MASDESCSQGNDFIKVMETFPCLFNIGIMKKPNHRRLSGMINTLEMEIAGDEKNEDTVRNLNILSWLYFQMGDLDEAKSKNDDALCQNTENLVSLGNRAFLEWYSGTQLSKFLDHLENLKSEEDFPEKTLYAKGVQAQLLFRLGGIYNMSSCIPVFDELVKAQPENFAWKYFLGLAKRRLQTMMRNYDDNREIERLYRDVAENAPQLSYKIDSMCELAILLSYRNRNVPDRVIEDLVREAMALSGESGYVLRQCGIALMKQFVPRAIDLLERSVSLDAHSVTLHNLAKCLVNPRLTRQRDQEECDKNAIRHFMESYELSSKENISPLVDLSSFYLTKNNFTEALRICRCLSQNWMVKDIYKNPYVICKIFDYFCQSLKKSIGEKNDPCFNRYLSISISAALEMFKRNASVLDQSRTFDLIVSPVRLECGVRSAKPLMALMKECTGDNSARQKLMMLKLQGRLEDRQSVEKEAENLLAKGQPGEALLVLDIAEMQEEVDHCHPNFSPNLRDQAMLEEAKWQLSQGLISCKSLFYKLFNMYHSRRSPRQQKEEIAARTAETESHETFAEADVLILQDGYHWKPFLQNNSGSSVTLTLSSPAQNVKNRIIEDVLINLFDLETVTNPWLPFSGQSRPDTHEFSNLLKHLNVRLVLLVIDGDTSQAFLKMVDCLLSETCLDNGTDTAIVFTNDADDDRAREQMPHLTHNQVRSVQTKDLGLQLAEDSKPVSDLVGLEMIDVYFSGQTDNVIEFFKFLAPPLPYPV